jgi:hypothetical protein
VLAFDHLTLFLEFGLILGKGVCKMTSILEELKKEVIVVHDKIVKASETNGNIKKLYKGCLIYVSPFYDNPKILFLGINPGGGYCRKNKEIQKQFDPLDKKETGYGLWKELENCFSKMGEEQLIDNMIKSNCYFFCTDAEKDLYSLFKILPNELRIEVLSKSQKWVKTLISEISPKIIICGGKSAMVKIQELYPEYECLERTNYTKAIKINGIYVISFRRFINIIRKKNEFIDYFKKYFSMANKG